MYFALLDGTGNNTTYVQDIAIKHGFEIKNENQYLCVIEEPSSKEVLGVIGFNCDGGTDYLDEGKRLEHEWFYVFENSFLSEKAQTPVVYKLVADWVFKFLVRSATLSAPSTLFPVEQGSDSHTANDPNCYYAGTDKYVRNVEFNFAIKRDLDELLTSCFKYIDKKLMESVLLTLGYNCYTICLTDVS